MKISLVLLLIFCVGLAHAAVYQFAPEKGSVSFTAKGKPALISIKGKGEGVKGDLIEKDGLISGSLVFPLGSLKTGIGMRDDHMKEKYLHVDKHPQATLKLEKLKAPKDLNSKMPFKGMLNLHGVDQAVEGEVSLQSQKGLEKLEAKFKIKLSQFQIEIPSYKGITVAEEVEIFVDSPFVRTE